MQLPVLPLFVAVAWATSEGGSSDADVTNLLQLINPPTPELLSVASSQTDGAQSQLHYVETSAAARRSLSPLSTSEDAMMPAKITVTQGAVNVPMMPAAAFTRPAQAAIPSAGLQQLSSAKPKPRAFAATSEEADVVAGSSKKPHAEEDSRDTIQSSKHKPHAFAATSEETGAAEATSWKHRPRAFKTISDEPMPVVPTPEKHHKPRAFQTPSEEGMPVVPTPAKHHKPRAFATPSEEGMPVVPTPAKHKPHAFATTSEEDMPVVASATKRKPHAFATTSEEDMPVVASATKRKPHAFATTSEEDMPVAASATKRKPQAFETTSEEAVPVLASATRKAKKARTHDELDDESAEKGSEAAAKEVLLKVSRAAESESKESSQVEESLKAAAKKEACNSWLQDCRSNFNVDACMQYKGFCTDVASSTPELVAGSAATSIGQTEPEISQMAADVVNLDAKAKVPKLLPERAELDRTSKTAGPAVLTAANQVTESADSEDSEDSADILASDVSQSGVAGFGTDKAPVVAVAKDAEKEAEKEAEEEVEKEEVEKEAKEEADEAIPEVLEAPEVEVAEAEAEEPPASAASEEEPPAEEPTPLEAEEMSPAEHAEPTAEAEESASEDEEEEAAPTPILESRAVAQTSDEELADAEESAEAAEEEPAEAAEPSTGLPAEDEEPVPRFGFTAASHYITSNSEHASTAEKLKTSPEDSAPGRAAWTFGQAASTMTNNQEVGVRSTTFELSRVDALGASTGSLGLAQSEGDKQHLASARENLCALWRSMCGRVATNQACLKYASICQ